MAAAAQDVLLILGQLLPFLEQLPPFLEIESRERAGQKGTVPDKVPKDGSHK